MKSNILIIILVSLISTNLWTKESSTKGNTKTKGGWTESYGGNGEIAEFKSLAREVFYVTNGIELDSKILNYDEIIETLNSAQIQCNNNLTLDGVSKDAINYPHSVPQKILLNCMKWNKLSSNAKISLAIHEFLPLIGFLDLDYQHSARIIKSYNEKRVYSALESLNFIEAAKDCNIDGIKDSLSKGANPFSQETKMKYAAIDFAIMGCNYTVVQEISELARGPIYNPEKFRYIEDRPDYSLIFTTLDTLLVLDARITGSSADGKNEYLSALSVLKIIKQSDSDLQLFNDQKSFEYENDIRISDLLSKKLMQELSKRPALSTNTMYFIKELQTLGYFNESIELEKESNNSDMKK